MIDFLKLRAFQGVARAGGFTRASEQLHLSQSTISQHIKQLEQELGCPLFLRVGKRVVISQAGEVLLQYADNIFRELKNAEMSVREMNALRRGTVRLGVGATTLTYRLPHILGEYNRRFPDIELIVLAGTTEFLLQSMRSKALDLAIIMSPKPETGLSMTPLGTEELVLVLNREHPLARKKILRPEDLTALRFILFEKHSVMQNLIDRWFEGLGVTPHITMEVENIEAIKALVRAGLGASLLPLCGVAGDAVSPRLRGLRVKDAPLVRELALVSPDAPALPHAIRALISVLVDGLHGR